jgi:dolichyl-phosphate-mannose-protein mannosyltransferase
MAGNGSSRKKPEEKVTVRSNVKSAGIPLSSKDGKPTDYTSHGVKDNDIFLLPGSDLQMLIGLTLLGAIVRLFKISQPSSVVFDEVQ